MPIARISTPTPLHATPVTRQVGIRQRSLGRRCRLGRATELVFVLVTGVTLALAGGAQAQVVWDGGADPDPSFVEGTNWVGDAVPTAGQDAELNDGGLINQPVLNIGDSVTVNALGVSAGTLTIDGTLTADGNTTVSGTGTVAIGATGTLLGTTTINSGGTVTSDGSIADVTNAGSFTNTGGAGAVTNADDGIGSNSGIIGSLAVTGGTFTNTGINLGNTTVSGTGTLILDPLTDLGNATSVTVSGDGTLTVNEDDEVGSVTLEDNGTIDGGDSLTTETYAQTGGTLAGTVVANTSATLTGGTISGTLDGAAAAITVSGSTTVSGSITGDVTVAGGGTLRLESDTAVTGTITTTGSVIDYADGVNSGAAITIASDTTQLQVTTGTAEQSGDIGEDAAGRPLEKIGVGTLTLSGTNTFTGDLTITGGTLAVTGGAAVEDSVEVVVGSGATLRLDANEDIGALSASASDAAVDVGAGNELDITGGTATIYAGTMAGTGSLINTGSATLTLTGDGSGFGGVLGATGTGAGIAITGAGQTGALGIGASTGNSFSTDGGALLASNTVLAADGAITFSGLETIGTITNSAADGPGTGTIALSGAGTTLTLSGEANPLNPGNISGMAGVISGEGALTVTGGTHDLSGENTYAGATTVSGGTLELTGSGSLSSTDITIDAAGRLTTDGGALQSTAAIQNDGTDAAGGFALTGGGSESIASLNGAGTVDLSSGSVLTLNSGASVISGVISGDGGLTIDGTSDTTLSGDNSYLGDTTVTATGRLTNDGEVADVTNAGTFTNTGSADNVTNSGTGFNDTEGTLLSLTNTGGTFDNAGAITDFLTVSGGTVTNESTGTVGGDTTITGGEVDNDGTLADVDNAAIFTNTGSADNVTNSGTGTNDTEGTLLSLTNTGGTFDNAGAITDFLTVTGGEVTNQTNGTVGGDLTVSGSGYVENDGLVEGATTITPDGVVYNYGELADVNNASQGNESEDYGFNNYGTAGDVMNSGTGFNGPGEVITPPPEETIALFDAPLVPTIASLVNTGDGLFDNEGTVTGSVTNAGEFHNNGSASSTGAFTNTGDATNEGTVASLENGDGGFFENDGTITGTVDVTGGTVINFGDGTVGGLTTITGDGIMQNGGVMGDVNNASGGGSLGEGGAPYGFINVGSLFFGGAGIAGTLTNSGTGLNLGGTIASLINSGTFETYGADFGSGAAETLAAPGSTGGITGTVDNGGTMFATGSIGGTIANSGSFTVGIGPFAEFADGFEGLDTNLMSEGAAFTNSGTGTLHVRDGDFTGLATLVNASSATYGVTVDAGRTLGVGTFTNQAGAKVLNNGTLAVGGSTLINEAGATFTNNGVVTGPVLNSGTLISNNGSSFSGGAFANLASGLFRPTGAVSVGGPAVNTGTVNMQNGSTGDRLTFGSTLAAGGSFALDANLANRTADLVTVAGATSGTPSFAFATTGTARLGQNILFFNANGGSYTVSPSQISGLATSGAVVSSVSQVGTGGDLYLVSQVNPAIGGVASNISLTQSLITTVINRPTDPLVDLGRVEGAACRSGGYARVSGGQATLTGESDNGLGNQDASIDSSFGSIQAGWDHGCYDGRYNGWDLAFGGLVGLTSGSSSQDVFQTNPANPSLLSSALAGSIDTNFDQQSVGVYMAARKDRFLANVQLRYDNTDFDFDESTVAGQIPMGLNGASASSQALTLGARINYVYAMSSPGLNFIPNAGFSYTHTDGDTVNFTNGSGQSLVLNSYNSMVGFAGGTLAKTVAGDSGKEATTTFMALNYYEDFGDDPTSVFYDGSGGSQGITTSNVGGFGEVSLGLNYFADVEGKMGGVKRMNAAIRADLRSGNNVSDAYALTAQLRLSF